MNSHSHADTTTALVPRLAGLTDELRERRRNRAARVAMRRELATYSTPAEVRDLLGALPERDDAAAEEIRSILDTSVASRPEMSHLAG
ncbi:hypothetical protein [Nocardioides plantarum]|uniref:Uncharacterized protein n=1 Tax=Nocardioides plantarum TaxID=29299 RepID=A0ABV5K7B0_9ACTN|nr:hypothetical protein [Nocardioides plantarum]